MSENPFKSFKDYFSYNPHHKQVTRGIKKYLPGIGRQYQGHVNTENKRRTSEVQQFQREWAKGPSWEEGATYGSINVTENDREFLSRMEKQAARSGGQLTRRPRPSVRNTSYETGGHTSQDNQGEN